MTDNQVDNLIQAVPFKNQYNANQRTKLTSKVMLWENAVAIMGATITELETASKKGKL